VTAGNRGCPLCIVFAEGHHLGSSFSGIHHCLIPNSGAICGVADLLINNGSGHGAVVQQRVNLPPRRGNACKRECFLEWRQTARRRRSGVATDVSLVVQSLTTSGNTTLPLVAGTVCISTVGTTPGATSVCGVCGWPFNHTIRTQNIIRILLLRINGESRHLLTKRYELLHHVWGDPRLFTFGAVLF